MAIFFLEDDWSNRADIGGVAEAPELETDHEVTKPFAREPMARVRAALRRRTRARRGQTVFSQALS